MSQKINISDYNASGVYFIEQDNSIITSSDTQSALRLAVGFNRTGPYNRPVYLSNTSEITSLFGNIDRWLERRGCFSNRSIRTMIAKTPIYFLNLLSVDTSDTTSNKDTVDYALISFDTENGIKTFKTPYAFMYDRSKFWIADDESFVKNTFIKGSKEIASTTKSINESALFGFGNCGTKDISVIVRQAENLVGYDVTFLDYFGSEDKIPYSWVNPYDYVSDYMFNVVAISGNWGKDKYETLAKDTVWGAYFTTDGIKKDKFNRFIKLDSVNVVGNWTGCVLPNFSDKQGRYISLDYLINKTCNETGLMFGSNTNALEYIGRSGSTFFYDENGDGTYEEGVDPIATFAPDIVGHKIAADKSDEMSFLSYNLDSSAFYTETVYTETTEVEATVSQGGELSAEFEVTDDNVVYVLVDGEEVAVEPTNAGTTVTVDKTELATYDVNKLKIEIVNGSTNAYATPNSVVTTDANYVFTINSEVAVDPSTNMVTFLTAYPEDTTFALSKENGANVNVGDYVKDKEGLLTKIIAKRGRIVGSTPVYSYTALRNIAVSSDNKVEIHKRLQNAYSTMVFTELKGLKLCNRHMPGYDSEGTVDYEAGVEKIYKVLEDSGIRRGLLNDDSIDFRYIVDTMAYGLKENCGGKKYLADIANNKKHCTALINVPSMSQFAASDAPFFGEAWDDTVDGRPTFDIKYIPEGGNNDMIYSSDTELFTLPSSEYGADHVGCFGPFLQYSDNNMTILVPPAADVSNTFMNKFLGGDPYVTVANRNGILSNSNLAGVEYLLDTEERGYLENFGINPIINRNGTIMVYGDRTAYQTVNSDLSFLHVREVLNTIQIACKEVLDDYVFTYNTATTRAEIVTRINPILSAMQNSNALAKYEIQCDELNNTTEIIDNKMCVVDIGVWVNPNMEKIIVPITINRSTTA